MRPKARNKVLLSLFLVTSAFVMNFGGLVSSDMMTGNGVMQPCPFMGTAALCHMSPLEHVSEWQSLFATTAQQFGIEALLLLLAFTLVWHFSNVLVVLKPREVYTRRQRYRERVFDPLRLLFSRGILNPKAY